MVYRIPGLANRGSWSMFAYDRPRFARGCRPRFQPVGRQALHSLAIHGQRPRLTEAADPGGNDTFYPTNLRYIRRLTDPGLPPA